MPKNKANYMEYLAKPSTGPLPDKIKCVRCNKIKPPAAYAGTRQNDLRTKMANDTGFNAATTGYIPCAMCTGGQVTELHCIMCSKWMALDRFAKTHRRTPDCAKCMKCINEQIAMPNADDSASGSDDSENDSDGSDDSYNFALDDSSSVADSSASVSLNSHGSTFNTASRGFGNGGGVKLGTSSARGTVWGGGASSDVGRMAALTTGSNTTRPIGLVLPHLRGRMTSASSESGAFIASIASNVTAVATEPARRVLPTGFNPNAYGAPGYPQGLPARSRASSSVNDGRKFAKVPAVKPKNSNLRDAGSADFDDICVSSDSDDDDGDDEPFAG